MITPSGSTYDMVMKDTGLGYALSIIGGKYKMVILFTLHTFKVLRFNELKNLISNISFKTLSTTLKQMETDNLVIRKDYSQIPPKVEYYLSEKGTSLIPVLQELCHWGESHSDGKVKIKEYEIINAMASEKATT